MIRALVLLCALTLAAPALANPPGQGPPTRPVEVVNTDPIPVEVVNEAPAPSCKRERFVFLGLSAGETDGDAGGFAGASQMCQDTFGPDTRICTAQDILESVYATPVPENAWVATRPDYMNADFPFSLWGTFTCFQYTFTSSTGLTITPGGRFAKVSCEHEQAVTCCGWVEIE